MTETQQFFVTVLPIAIVIGFAFNAIRQRMRPVPLTKPRGPELKDLSRGRAIMNFIKGVVCLFIAYELFQYMAHLDNLPPLHH